MKGLHLLRLGTIAYDEAFCLQKRLVDQVHASQGREAYLLLLEHPPVITIGRRGTRDNVLASPEELDREGVEIRDVNRGGDVTYHGPGQIVGYPILKLLREARDIHGYLRALEQFLMDALGDFGIVAERVPQYTGVWTQGKKIAAIGVALTRWITYHGFSLNVDPQLRHFGLIHPCGITDRGVTSMREVLGRPVATGEVEEVLLRHFQRVFEFDQVLESGIQVPGLTTDPDQPPAIAGNSPTRSP